MNIPTLMVFDVESVGLQGEGYAVGWVVLDPKGSVLEEGVECCLPKFAAGSLDAHTWAMTNSMPVPPLHGSPMGVRLAFWKAWRKWYAASALLASDCPWPVEARFLLDCVRDNPHQREWEGPYPFVDIASVLFAKGMDPIGTYERLPNELPAHNPLADSRQSARLLRRALLL